MSEYRYLSKINSPADLKGLQEEEIASLAKEIREFLVEKVTENGGHLASNLGVVELTLAIHRVFDVPHDHLIFDVGHQSYVHKIVTGRREDFDTLRRGGGLSGFTKRSESEYDCFGAGHSSTSVSAGIGFAQADKLLGNDATTVVVLGDGAFTGGMVHEALNNIERDLHLVIVLNENEMSISKNIGSFARILTKLRLHSGYVRTKQLVKRVVLGIPLIGKYIFKALQSLKMRIKDIFYGSNYFENLGLFYVGPVDGNDEKQVEDALRIARSCKESAIVHVKTIKGMGYEPAEKDPSKYHGISPRNARSAETSFSEQFGLAMLELAEQDSRICAISAAMLDGTGLLEFSRRLPDRIFDVGIAEEHALTFACGLAAEGMKPYFAVYSTFLQRSYDNMLHDMALQGLPVRICIDRAGLNASDGPTHHGIYDVAMLSQIPNMTVYAPVTYDALRCALAVSVQMTSPCAIRYPKGGEHPEIVGAFYSTPADSLTIRKNYSDKDNIDTLIITHGQITLQALRAQDILSREGIRAGVILAERIMPYADLARDVASAIPDSVRRIVTLEEEIKAGGFGMMLREALDAIGAIGGRSTRIIAVENSFADKYGEDIYASMGLDGASVAEKIRKM